MNLKKLSMHSDLDCFPAATEAEQEYMVQMRPSTTFFKDGMKRLLKNKIATISMIVIILVTLAALILPIFTLSLSPMANITRLTRSSMLDVLGQDYIRTARAKGVSQVKIIFGHALKNSLIPVITYFGPMLAYIVTGSLVVEKIFAVNGIGRAFVGSITDRDYPLIMGTTIVLAALIVVMNLISDILYKVVDPRITLE